jgi:hypothetical protein
MSMVWITILALVATPGEPSCRLDRAAVRLAAASADMRVNPVPSCSLSVGRTVGRRHGPAPWTTNGLDEFDTEELDETWIVDLDLMASMPVDWLVWDLPRTLPEPYWIASVDPPSLSYFPLRC